MNEVYLDTQYDQTTRMEFFEKDADTLDKW